MITILLLGTYTYIYQMLCMKNIHSSIIIIIINSLKLKTTHMFIKLPIQVNKIPSIHTTETYTVIRRNRPRQLPKIRMNLTNSKLKGRSQPQRSHRVWLYLIKVQPDKTNLWIQLYFSNMASQLSQYHLLNVISSLGWSEVRIVGALVTGESYWLERGVGVTFRVMDAGYMDAFSLWKFI